ncbi:efflux RND transporter periplasmic adaptor subunit [Novipirellula artificiosorum]|uniref:efflux RND transporter periplasmic adaptor subunit n=1 Tax=Novipirellula artificiosorum TaxID=2528016 RepID=UPI0018CE8D33|nr:HlyD family efflux transporter periplasmic adaptor subunit [Novipirellula artificiosorum]
MKKIAQSTIVLAVLCVSAMGCKSKRDEVEVKSARPVSVLTLLETDPGRFDRYTGAVASWKTDKLGFEVAGRVEFVVEPETDILGDLSEPDAAGSISGTELARLDPTRYELSVKSAKAQITTAEKQREAAQIELDHVIPAQQEAAAAQVTLAEIEVQRNESLVAQNAGSQRDLDMVRSKFAEAQANVKQVQALREAKGAEVASIEASILELEEALREAERDLADCRLHWSVPGQVAEVHVIAGSYVERGDPVVTVQMMHPIKVEFEVSASTAQNLNHREQVRIYIPQPDGSILQQVAVIYMIDPVADPNTRTFTITLMLPNTKTQSELPAEFDSQVVARTSTIGMLIAGFGANPKSLFVKEQSLHQDDDGYYILRILNQRIGMLSQESQRVLKVEKLRVIPGELRIPILGIAVLREVEFADGVEMDPTTDMFVEEITLPAGNEEAWSGDLVFYDVQRWKLRPGDLVSIDLAGDQTQPGFYVPLDAIMERSGTHFVFVIDQSEDRSTVRKLEVTVHDPVGSLRRIEAVDDQPLEEGAKIVAAGAVFLNDGETVSVAEEVEVRR